MLKPFRYLLIATFTAILLPCIAEEAPTVTFDIVHFEVSGNSYLPADKVDKVLQPYTGKSRSFGDVQAAQEQLAALFRQRGFALVAVNIPEQELNQGIVKFLVVQPKIGKVSIKGNKVFTSQNIRRNFPALREGESPNVDKISSSLKLVNESPAKKASFSLQAGAQPDEVDARINITDQKIWKLGVNLDNSGSDETGKTHLGLSAQNANLFDRDHVLGLFYLTTVEKPSSISVYGLNYHIPLYSLGDSVDFYGNYSDVDSGSVAIETINVLITGKGTVFGAHYNQQLIRINQYESKVIYGVDYKAYVNGVLLVGDNVSTEAGHDVTVHPLSLSYVGSWNLSEGSAGISLTAIHNVPGGVKGDSEAIAQIRSDAEAAYSILRYSANFTQRFDKDWMMRVNFSGQYSRDALIPGEQFGVGGSSSVRGFMEREVANDSGYITNLEFYSPNTCSRFKSSSCRILAFYDNGHVSSNNALATEVNHESIGGAGLGLRIDVAQSLNLQMDYGVVVDPGGNQRDGDTRAHIAMNWSY